MQLKFIVVVLCLNFLSCDSQRSNQHAVSATQKASDALKDRIRTPDGYQRTEVAENSFGQYLRNLKLKPQGAKVHYYDGAIKPATGVYLAVVDADIGEEDLHQCADAIIRLKSDYHYHAGDYDKIKFNFTNGHRVAYSEWRKGRRIKFDGNKTWWDEGSKPTTSYKAYWEYLEQVFMYAGTYSLAKELQAIPIMKMEIGDILIKGGFPGHGVIVIDMAVNPDTGQKLYMLAQSYMPAQETQILINASDSTLSPWYRLNETEHINTPEYSFDNTDLMRFPG